MSHSTKKCFLRFLYLLTIKTSHCLAFLDTNTIWAEVSFPSFRNVMQISLHPWEKAAYSSEADQGESQKTAAFVAKPFGFTRQLQCQKCCGHLACMKDEAESTIHSAMQNGRWV